MGRKKKTKEITVNNSSSIKYFGDVTIQRVKNGKIISTQKQHNAGGTELFKFLLNCLAGEFIGKDKPQVVTPAFEDPSGIKYRSTRCYTISNIMSSVTNTENMFVEYKFYLPYDSSFTLNDGFNRLVIYSDNKKPGDHINNTEILDTWSMYVVLTENIKPELDEDIILTWHLKIENKDNA